jgi:hypothetical protein
MLIFEVISSISEETSGPKYKCPSGPRKGQRVAKIATCSAPIKRRGASRTNDDDGQEPRKYVPKTQKKKTREKKKLRPNRSSIRAESKIVEYGGSVDQAKITKVMGKKVTVNNGNGTEITVDTEKDPEALTKDDKGNTVYTATDNTGRNSNTNSATRFQPGQAVTSKK